MKMNEGGSEVGDGGSCKRVAEEAVTSAKGKHAVVGTNFDPHHGRGGDARSPADYLPYPKPLASYEEVVADSKLFRETLEKLHSTMRTKFMIPIIGGKDLDLHRLFVEVTSRGGIEKVIADRKWREVTAAFTFPSTATNASFVLRKYYMSLLHHYEQIYFFRSEGWTAPAPIRIPSATSGSSKRLIEHNVLYPESKSASGKRKRKNGSALPQYPQVVGVIDGKFEHGYFVTVNVGSNKLRGVLYHIPQQTSDRPTAYANISDNSNNFTTGRRQRRRKKLSKRDPSHPKPNRSGYNFFFAEQHAKLKPLYPGKDREISKMIGDSWNKLSETEKAVYQDKGVKDKERYRNEMAVYMEKLKAGHVISNAVPIQQRPADPEMVVEGRDSKLHNAGGDLTLNGENDYSSEGSDSEGKLSDEDSEMEDASPEFGAGSANLAEPSTEGDDFELRQRVESKSETVQDLCSANRETESKKLMEMTDGQ